MSGLVRVGVMLAVAEPLGAELAHWRRVFADPLADAVPPHITVLPPALMPVRLLPEIVSHLADVACRCAPFTVELHGTGTFRPVSPVVFAALDAGAAECAELHRQVCRGPLAVPTQFPFHPHVTIAHGVAEPLLDKAQESLGDLHAAFDVDALDLYLAGDADSGQPWVRHRRLELAGRAA